MSIDNTLNGTQHTNSSDADHLSVTSGIPVVALGRDFKQMLDEKANSEAESGGDQDSEKGSDTRRSSADELDDVAKVKTVRFAESEKDFDPNSAEEKAVAVSPNSRFLKFDIEIGRGSFKTVYKGLDTETGVAVAWCELQPPNYMQDNSRKGLKEEQSRFKEEAKMLKTLQHPNILKFYDSWERPMKSGGRQDGRNERKTLILITELMTSGTLKGYLRRFKDVKPRIIRSWGRQILKGLNYLHSRTPPIIHRDLKCDNIFINGTTGLVKIGDLGLATLKRSDVKTVIGTPEFMAPEMYDEHYDESVDVYAFGMCLLEMTTLQYPYMECSNPGQIYKKVTQGKKPHALEKVKDHVILDIIKGCIHEQKDRRYTVKDLLAHPFFAAELIDVQATRGDKSDELVLQISKKGGKGPQNQSAPEEQALEIAFNLQTDTAQDIAQEMVRMNYVRDTEVESVTRSIQEKVDDMKRVVRGEPATPLHHGGGGTVQLPSLQHVISQEPAEISAELQPQHKQKPIEEDKVVSVVDPPAQQPQTIPVADVDVDSTAVPVERPVQLTDVVLVKAESVEKKIKTEPVERKPLASPDPIPTISSPMPPVSAAPIQHRPLKDHQLHSTESSSELSLVSDSQVSVGREYNEPAPVVQVEDRKEEIKEVDDQLADLPHTNSQPEVSSTAKASTTQKKVSRSKSVVKVSKEKRQLRLTIVSIKSDLVECTLSNAGQAITFQFRLGADNSEDIAQGLVNANHLLAHQKEEFTDMANTVMKMARRNERGVVGSKEKGPAGTTDKSKDVSKIEKLDGEKQHVLVSGNHHPANGNKEKVMAGSQQPVTDKHPKVVRTDSEKHASAVGSQHQANAKDFTKESSESERSEKNSSTFPANHSQPITKDAPKVAKGDSDTISTALAMEQPVPMRLDSQNEQLQPAMEVHALVEHKQFKPDQPKPTMQDSEKPIEQKLPKVPLLEKRPDSTGGLSSVSQTSLASSTQELLVSLPSSPGESSVEGSQIIPDTSTKKSPDLNVIQATGALLSSAEEFPAAKHITTTAITGDSNIALPSTAPTSSRFIVELVPEMQLQYDDGDDVPCGQDERVEDDKPATPLETPEQLAKTSSDNESSISTASDLTTVGEVHCKYGDEAATALSSDTLTTGTQSGVIESMVIQETPVTTVDAGMQATFLESATSVGSTVTSTVAHAQPVASPTSAPQLVSSSGSTSTLPELSRSTASPIISSSPVFRQSAIGQPVNAHHASSLTHATGKPDALPEVDISRMSESIPILLYQILQVLRNPTMEAYVKTLEHKYGQTGEAPFPVTSGPVSPDYTNDHEYQRMQEEFRQEEKQLKEKQQKRMNQYIQKKRSSHSSAVANGQSPTPSRHKHQLSMDAKDNGSMDHKIQQQWNEFDLDCKQQTTTTTNKDVLHWSVDGMYRPSTPSASASGIPQQSHTVTLPTMDQLHQSPMGVPPDISEFDPIEANTK